MNILLGDIHGNVKVLMKYIHRGFAENGCIYQMGDFGIFNFDDDPLITREDLDDIDAKLIEKNTKLRIIRGNHDNPYYWNNLEARKLFNKTYSNIELLSDYHVENIDGMDVLFIGGAVSVDRNHRMEGVDWWADEIITHPIDGIESLPEVDVVVSHNCPSWWNLTSDSKGIKTRWAIGDDTLVEDLESERKILDEVFHQVKPKRWFSGHFHNFIREETYDCKYRCIGINELYALTEDTPMKNMNTELIAPRPINEVKQWVREQHDRMGQTRVNGEPYWTHTERVANLVRKFHDDLDIYLAALAHDIVEDVDDLDKEEVIDMIGSEAYKLVLEVTNVYTKERYPSMNRAERKEAEASRLGKISTSGKVIKLADIIDNLSDVDDQKPHMAVKYKNEKAVVIRNMFEDDKLLNTLTPLYEMAQESARTDLD